MATDLVDWYGEARFHVPKITLPSIEHAARLACIRFCERTWLYSQDLTRIDVVEDTYEYALADPTDTEILAVDDVMFKVDEADDDQFSTLAPISEVQMKKFIGGGWKYHDSAGPSEYWADVVNKKLWLKPPPDADSGEGLLVTAILKPDLDCTSVSDFFYDDYRDEITIGMLEVLFSQSAMSWFNPGLAAMHKVDFRNICNDLKWKRITGIANRPLQLQSGGFSKARGIRGSRREDRF